jgi:uncharacterized protein (DUF1800 family)
LIGLTACGGGGSAGSSSSSSHGILARLFGAASSTAPSQSDASRFLAQATFGATDADIASVTSQGYSAWIDAQEAMPVSGLHLAHMDSRLPQLQAVSATAKLSADQFYESFWQQAATSPDQLRQRVKLALSEIFVTSFSSSTEDCRGIASYYDMLGADAFGNFRTLLNDVTYHPAMGLYMTYLANQKENAKTGQNPDQNYAREIMQLMTIGLYKLNTDGTLNTDLLGNAQPSYTTADIMGLSKVFTGLSWYTPTPTTNTYFGGNKAAAAYVTPMMVYNTYHSISEKDFLGTTIPATTTADTNADIKTALDTLFNNANVGPFISKQLIQRLVTSNPSPAYVGRVAAVFNDNGSGVRGDMKAVIKAILMDDEARTASTDADYGKLREPVVRLGNWMRSFGTTSQSGNWLIGSTSGNTSLGQSAMNSPSVFNFYRPGYVPPNTTLGGKNMLAPEFETTNEASTAAYVNTMQWAIGSGLGTTSISGLPDVSATYTNELALSNNPQALVDRINLLLDAQLSAAHESNIVNEVASVTASSTGALTDTPHLNRVRLALILTMASPDYMAQR